MLSKTFLPHPYYSLDTDYISVSGRKRMRSFNGGFGLGTLVYFFRMHYHIKKFALLNRK